VLLFGRKMYVANLGDSRVLMIKKGNDRTKKEEDDFDFKQLSKDHTLYDEDEKTRVQLSNGRVDQLRDKNGNSYGPLRVWLNKQNEPGLAMTRSFGDSIAKHIGVIAEPELQIHKLHRDDRMIVLASDGIWEFLSNQEVAEIVFPFYFTGNAEGASEKLIAEASDRWKQENNNGIKDDITCQILFLTNQ
jgi:serine/threonine protein phosphatase PrpC